MISENAPNKQGTIKTHLIMSSQNRASPNEKYKTIRSLVFEFIRPIFDPDSGPFGFPGWEVLFRDGEGLDYRPATYRVFYSARVVSNGF